MRGEELMTDEQFNTYNQLLGLVDRMIKILPEKEQEKFSKQKDEILSKQTK
jgi:hypothetical protein